VVLNCGWFENFILKTFIKKVFYIFCLVRKPNPSETAGKNEKAFLKT